MQNCCLYFKFKGEMFAYTLYLFLEVCQASSKYIFSKDRAVYFKNYFCHAEQAGLTSISYICAFKKVTLTYITAHTSDLARQQN